MCAEFFQLAAVLDEYKTGVWRAEKFHVDTYRPVHEGILTMMETIEADRYHASKCRAFRREWARAARSSFFLLYLLSLIFY